MSGYAVFLNKDGTTIRLPVNPEEIEITTVQANEKYEILKQGQIVVPTHMELRAYSFECEFPKEAPYYVETLNEFKEPSFYLVLLRNWRLDLKPIRLMVTNDEKTELDILVLIEEMNVTEKAGEEGDKYVSFKFIEYRSFGKKKIVETDPITQVSTIKTEESMEETNPKSTGSHVVVSGDTLWGIAKKYYGNGNQYNKILEANKDKIKNANLIYPGQKLVIP